MWRAPPEGVLRRVPLDSMTAIYDRRSGETHVVAEIVSMILDTIGTEDITTDWLSVRLGADTDMLSDRLAEMAAVGLLERL